MKKYVPLNKQSKRNQQAYHRLQRGDWNCDPVTRIAVSSKVYRRARQKQLLRRERTDSSPAVKFCDTGHKFISV